MIETDIAKTNIEIHDDITEEVPVPVTTYDAVRPSMNSDVTLEDDLKAVDESIKYVNGNIKIHRQHILALLFLILIISAILAFAIAVVSSSISTKITNSNVEIRNELSGYIDEINKTTNSKFNSADEAIASLKNDIKNLYDDDPSDWPNSLNGESSVDDKYVYTAKKFMSDIIIKNSYGSMEKYDGCTYDFTDQYLGRVIGQNGTYQQFEFMVNINYPNGPVDKHIYILLVQETTIGDTEVPFTFVRVYQYLPLELEKRDK